MGNKHSSHLQHHPDPTNIAYFTNSKLEQSNQTLSPTVNSQNGINTLFHEVIHTEDVGEVLPKHLFEALKQQAKSGNLARNTNNTPQSSSGTTPTMTPRGGDGSGGGGVRGHERQTSFNITPTTTQEANNNNGRLTLGGNNSLEITLTTPNNAEKTLSSTTPRGSNKKNDTPRGSHKIGFSSSSSSSKESIVLPTSNAPRSGSAGNVIQSVNRTKFRMERDLQIKSCFTLDEFKLFKGIFLSFCNICFQQSSQQHLTTPSMTPRQSNDQLKTGKRDSVTSSMSNSSSMTSINGSTPGRTILRQALLASSVSYYDIHQLFLSQAECQQLLFQHGKVLFSINRARSKSNPQPHAHYQPNAILNIQQSLVNHEVPIPPVPENKRTSPPLSTSPNAMSHASPPQTTFIPTTVPPLSLTTQICSMGLSNVEDLDMDLLEKFVTDAIYRAVTDCHQINDHHHHHHHHPHLQSTESFVLTFQRFILSLAAASISIRDGQVYAQKISRLSMSTIFSEGGSDIEEHEQLKREALLRERSSIVFTMLDLDRDDCLSRDDLLTFMIAMDRLNLLTLKRTKGMIASARKNIYRNNSELDLYSDGGSPIASEKSKGKKSAEEENVNVLSSSLLTSAVAQSMDQVEVIKIEKMNSLEKFKLFETLVDQFFDYSYNQRKNSSLLNLKSAYSLTLTRAEFFDNSQIFDDIFLNGLGIFEAFFIPIMKPVHEFLTKSEDAYEISGKLKNMFSQQTYFCEIKGSMMFLYDVDPSTLTENSDIQSKCIETIDLRTCVKVINEKQPELITPPTTPSHILHNSTNTNGETKKKKSSILNSRHSGDDEMFQDSVNPQSPASPSTSMPTTTTLSQVNTSSQTTQPTDGKPTFSFSTSPYFSFLTLQSASQPNAGSPSNTAFVSLSSNFAARKYMFMADENEQKVAWLFTLFMHITQTTELNNRFHSFAPERENVKIKWYVDGQDTFRDIAIAMDRAKEEIFISDWLLSPLMYLIRGDAPRVAESRLDILLKNKAAQGVKIYIILWKETSVAGLNLDTRTTKKYLRSLFPRNIFVCSHPKRYPLDFTHHQKIVVVDQSVAFVGGLDLAYGRWDDHHHSLTDDNHTALKYPGADYLNPNIFPLNKFEGKLAHFSDALDREFIPREPWHDVHSMVSGLLARDVSLNFIERWNHHTKATPSDCLQLKPVKKNPLFEYYKLQNASLARKEKIKKRRNPFVGMQNLNIYNNISNIQNTPRRLKQFFAQYNTPPATGQLLEEPSNKPVPIMPLPLTNSPIMKDDHHPQDGSSSAHAPGSPRIEGRMEGVRARTKSWFEKHNPNTLIKRGTDRDRDRDKEREKERERERAEKEKEEKLMKEILKEKKREAKHTKNSHEEKKVEEISCPEDEGFVCNAQIVRSIARWSGGSDTEQSIYLAYLNLIEEAQHFIYIENQFFTGGTAGSPAKNAVPLFLAKKIVEKMRRGELFRVYVIVPSHPEGDLAVSSVNQLLKYQYKTINRSPTSVFSYIKHEYPEATDELIEQYIVFFCLRNYGFMNNNDLMKYYQAATKGATTDSDSDEEKVFDDKWRNQDGISSDEYTSDEEKKKKKRKRKNTNSSFVDKIPTGKRAVTEHVYVHSKLMIVDDRHTIIGTANINDRSMLGNRDSEIAVVISDKTFTTSKMNGRPYRAGKFAHSLRMRLWKEHLGLFPKKKEQKLLEKRNDEISHVESEEDMRASIDTTADQMDHLVPPPPTSARDRLMGTNMAKIFHLDRSQASSRPKSKLELELEEHERKRTQIEDPVHNETHNLIMTLARKNAEIYDTVFTDIVSDRYRTIEAYVEARSKIAVFDSTLVGTNETKIAKENDKVMVVSKSQHLDDMLSPASASTNNSHQHFEESQNDQDHHLILSPSRAVLKLSKKIHDMCITDRSKAPEFVNQANEPTQTVNPEPVVALAKTEVEKRKLLKKVNGFLCLFPLRFAEDDQFKKSVAVSVAVDDIVFL